MSEIYVIRVVLDADEDVLRDLAIQSESTLFDLHSLIVEAFDLERGEMSSFFKSNEEWDQGEEISMMDFDPETGQNPLDRTLVSNVFNEDSSRMLFVYDYLELWTFYLELLEIRKAEPGKNYPQVLAGVGERPESAPHKEMKSEGPDEDIFNFDEGDDDPEAEDMDNDLWH